MFANKNSLMFKPLFCRPLAESTENDTAVFLVKGLSIGQTTLSAVVMDKDGRKIASGPQPIEVWIQIWHLKNLKPLFYINYILFLGISTLQTHPQENDSANWCNDAGMCSISSHVACPRLASALHLFLKWIILGDGIILIGSWVKHGAFASSLSLIRMHSRNPVITVVHTNSTLTSFTSSVLDPAKEDVFPPIIIKLLLVITLNWFFSFVHVLLDYIWGWPSTSVQYPLLDLRWGHSYCQCTGSRQGRCCR